MFEDTKTLFMKLVDSLPYMDFDKDPEGGDFRKEKCFSKMLDGDKAMTKDRCVRLGGSDFSSGGSAGKFILSSGMLCVYLQRGRYKAVLEQLPTIGRTDGISARCSFWLLGRMDKDIRKKMKGNATNWVYDLINYRLTIEQFENILSYFPFSPVSH